ncbi:hypothetical protein E4L96_02670 [Massilia arenosa]|uniref:Lipoprotein n=1 Tax=Zemynaea arenosa TaxID=2561931 RepID=A0A4Y9SSH9_9BURK|nr:DUF6279 family lipoprotein [Massilia arenosa]TFW28164.1 hypothetical protein E4L96_02670 [Massilia arenosa]
MLLALGLLLLMSACSTIRFTYDHGDTLLYWWLNAYLDIDSDQKAWVKRDIDAFFDWHRKTQLPDYVNILRTAQKQLAGNPTQQDLLGDYKKIRDETRELMVKSLPDLVDLARSVKPEQIERMEKKFEKNNADYRKKFMSGSFDHRKEVRYDKAMEQFKLWFGSFSREQEAQIRRLSDARPLDNDIWLDERMRRQKRIIEVVRKIQAEKLSKEAATPLVAGLIKDTVDRFDQPDRKAFFDGYVDTTSKFILAVIQLTTPEQRAHAQDRMQGWINDLNTLAAEGR